MDIKYMLACIFMSMGPAKHEKVAIFRRKMSEFRMFASILRVQSTKNRHQAHLSGNSLFMIPESKGLNPHELAQMWVNVLETLVSSLFISNLSKRHFTKEMEVYYEQ